jgi:hypothetical protein
MVSKFRITSRLCQADSTIPLKGDDYSLIWDPRLIHKYDAPPMDYDAPPPVQVDRVTDQDLIENFVNYLKVSVHSTNDLLKGA